MLGTEAYPMTLPQALPTREPDKKQRPVTMFIAGFVGARILAATRTVTAARSVDNTGSARTQLAALSLFTAGNVSAGPTQLTTDLEFFSTGTGAEPMAEVKVEWVVPLHSLDAMPHVRATRKS